MEKSVFFVCWLQFKGVADNATDNSHAFRGAAASTNCSVLLVPEGIWMTGPFNMTSNKILYLAPGATISGSRDPATYPIVTQLPVDEVGLFHYVNIFSNHIDKHQ